MIRPNVLKLVRSSGLLLIVLTSWLCTNQNVFATINYSDIITAGYYYENFDGLNSVNGTDNAWVNNSTIPYWYASQSQYRTDNGNYSQYSRMMSYGSWGDSDRALGNIFNAYTGATNSWGIRIYNNTAVSISSFSVQYTGEQWRARNYGSGPTERIRFMYAVGNSNLGIQAGVYNPVPQLDFYGPNSTNIGAVDGNLAANSETIYYNFSGFFVAPGQYLMLRWDDIVEKTGTSNDGLAIDDVYIALNYELPDELTGGGGGGEEGLMSGGFEAVPEPSTLVFFGLTSVGALFAARRRKKTA